MRFLNLSTTHRWQHEVIVFQNVAASCVNLTTVFASEVFLGFSVFNAGGADDSAIDHHILANMALSDVPDTVQGDFLERRNIRQPDIEVFL